MSWQLPSMLRTSRPHENKPDDTESDNKPVPGPKFVSCEWVFSEPLRKVRSYVFELFVVFLYK